MTTFHAAARTIATQEHIPIRTDDADNPGRRELLDMLGLVETLDGKASIIVPLVDDSGPGAGMAICVWAPVIPSDKRGVTDRDSLPTGLRHKPARTR